MAIPSSRKVRILWALLILFALIQLYRPARTNPPVEPGRDIIAMTNPSAEVAAILRASCFDCHSHETRWPWYSRIAPVSWLVAHDVDEGREHFNLSEWADYTPKAAAHKLEELCELVVEGEMPRWFYLPAHPGARLDDAQKKTLCTWAAANRGQGASGVSAEPEHDH